MKRAARAVGGRRASMPRSVFALLASGLAALVLSVGHEGRSTVDAIEECASYMQTVQRCSGVPAARIEWREVQDRERTRARCVAAKMRLERACR